MLTCKTPNHAITSDGVLSLAVSVTPLGKKNSPVRVASPTGEEYG